MVTIQQQHSRAAQWDTPIDGIQSVSLPTRVMLPYVVQGDPAGVPVELLHGTPTPGGRFTPGSPTCPARSAPSLTQRGHGDASRPAAGYHPRDFAADVAAFLDSQDLEAAVIAGHSMGSTVALRFASDSRRARISSPRRYLLGRNGSA